MGSVKDQLLDIEAERFDKWLEENHCCGQLKLAT